MLGKYDHATSGTKRWCRLSCWYEGISTSYDRHLAEVAITLWLGVMLVNHSKGKAINLTRNCQLFSLRYCEAEIFPLDTNHHRQRRFLCVATTKKGNRASIDSTSRFQY